MSINDMHVYKMNDYEWWVSEWCIERTNEWYLNFHGLDSEENPIDEIYEVDKDLEGMWIETFDVVDVSKFNNSNDILSGYQKVFSGDDRVTRFGDLKIINGSIFKYISFREAIIEDGNEESIQEPYMIATTEF